MDKLRQASLFLPSSYLNLVSSKHKENSLHGIRVIFDDAILTVRITGDKLALASPHPDPLSLLSASVGFKN